jgi:cytochrome b6-f complex iron-sulfur subunit
MNRIAATTDTTAAADGRGVACGLCRPAAGEPTQPTQPVKPTETTQAQPGAGGPTRRRVVTTGALGALAATALAACGGDEETPGTTPPAGETGSASAGGTSSAGAGGDVIAKVADVPVGGAIAGQTPDGTKVILSQPKAGEVVAFDARCPHQGCTVAPSGDTLRCPCHGSTFETTDGAVINGPATKGLQAVSVTISGDDIIAG